MRMRYVTEADRFWCRVAPAGPADCWLWNGGKKAAGYGNMAVRKPDGSWTQTPAHRWVYLHMVGPIPPGFEIDHVCQERGCVNPCHLEAVTLQENRRRRDADHPFRLTRDPVPMPHAGPPILPKPQPVSLPATHCRNGHEYAVMGWTTNGRNRTCAACRAVANEKRRKGGAHGTETRCPHGHPYSPENTYVRARGGRECRACIRARSQR